MKLLNQPWECPNIRSLYTNYEDDNEYEQQSVDQASEVNPQVDTVNRILCPLRTVDQFPTAPVKPHDTTSRKLLSLVEYEESFMIPTNDKKRMKGGLDIPKLLGTNEMVEFRIEGLNLKKEGL